MNMTKCELNSFPCIDVKYATFNKICSKELRTGPTAESIINDSEFCVNIPLTAELTLDFLETNDYLVPLRRKVGLYHLWVEHDSCDDHDNHTLLCAYVGKGSAEDRIKSHIKEKFPDSDTLYITFFECENRVAKYLEQLFLDTYNFALNKYENRGTEDLFAVWDEERFIHGTQLHDLANQWARGNGPGPYEI